MINPIILFFKNGANLLYYPDIRFTYYCLVYERGCGVYEPFWLGRFACEEVEDQVLLGVPGTQLDGWEQALSHCKAIEDVCYVDAIGGENI